jgi:hypothetical protein
LLKIQAILPETNPFLSAQMAVLSSFFQMLIVLGMYNFFQHLSTKGFRKSHINQISHYLSEHPLMHFKEKAMDYPKKIFLIKDCNEKERLNSIRS